MQREKGRERETLVVSSDMHWAPTRIHWPLTSSPCLLHYLSQILFFLVIIGRIGYVTSEFARPSEFRSRTAAGLASARPGLDCVALPKSKVSEMISVVPDELAKAHGRAHRCELGELLRRERRTARASAHPEKIPRRVEL